MGKIRLTGQADLTVMHPGRVNIGAVNNIYLCLRMIFNNLIYDIVYSDQIWLFVPRCCRRSIDAEYSILGDLQIQTLGLIAIEDRASCVEYYVLTVIIAPVTSDR